MNRLFEINLKRSKLANKIDSELSSKDSNDDNATSVVKITNQSASPSSTTDFVIDITDEECVNDIIENTTDLIEISHSANKNLENDYILKLNEIYNKVRKAIIILIKSLNGTGLILWRNKKIEIFLQINLNFDIENIAELYELTRKFIKKSLEEDHIGLAENLMKNDKWKKAKLDITQLADSRGYNLLMFAAEVNAKNLIEELLKIGFTINDRVQKTLSSDVAWENKNYELLTILLNNNSRLPDDFENYAGNAEEFPQCLRNFLIILREFYEAIDGGNEEKLKELIDQNKHLRHYFNAWNSSAATFALLRKNLQLYEFFTINNITFGPLEPTSQIIETLSDADREKLSRIHSKHTKALPEQHINVIVANTNLGHDSIDINEKQNLVEKTFYILNSITIVQLILRAVAASKKFNIVMDFNRKHVQFLNPTIEADSDGLFDSSIGRISIAAKQMFDDVKRNEVYGTIAHELCHYAMFLVYQNNGKPYHKSDKAKKWKFERISKYCERRSKREMLIDIVYDGYDLFMWHAELIVRVPHLTMLYHDQPQKLDKVRVIFKPLFDYYENIVAKDMEKALATIGRREEVKKQKRKKENWILRIILALIFIASIIAYFYYKPENLEKYKWDKLSDGQRDKILNSKFNFQGQLVRITELLNDTSNLNIEPVIAQDFLKYDKVIAIDKAIGDGKSKTFYIERKFIERNESYEPVTFNSIVSKLNINEFKTFILSDQAGTGKTTTFINLAERLKSNFTRKWITHVILRDHIKSFTDENIDLPLVDFIGEKIFNLTKVDLRVFKNLFNDNKVIFLWDGFDEISPKYENFTLKFLAKVKNETNNIQFISTRTLYTETLEKTLNVKAHKFIPYSDDDRDDFVIAYAEENKFSIREAIKSQSYLDKFLKKLKSDVDITRDVNNPLMLKIFLNTFSEKLKKSIKNKFINFYSVYDDFVKAKNDISFDRSTDKQNAVILRDITDRQHQMLALNFIIKDAGIRDIRTNEIHDLMSLDIMENNATEFIVDLSKIGIIDLDRNSFTDEIDFTFGHRTFAEFFIAQYLIKTFYTKDPYKLIEQEKILRLEQGENNSDENFSSLFITFHQLMKIFIKSDEN